MQLYTGPFAVRARQRHQHSCLLAVEHLRDLLVLNNHLMRVHVVLGSESNGAQILGADAGGLQEEAAVESDGFEEDLKAAIAASLQETMPQVALALECLKLIKH